MSKKIFTILPYKESLDSNFAGAVSIYAKDITKFSKYKKSKNFKPSFCFR